MARRSKIRFLQKVVELSEYNEASESVDKWRQLIRLWGTRLPNDPVGDTPFWTDALERRLASEFAGAAPAAVGEWRGLRLLDRSDTHYVWVVYVRAVGKDLDVVQVFYPSAAAEERYAPAVRAVLGAGGAA